MAFSKGDLVYLFNFHPTKSQDGFLLPVNKVGAGRYQVVFSTDDEAYGGQGRISEDTIYQTEFTKARGLAFKVYSPCRTAMVLKRFEH